MGETILTSVVGGLLKSGLARAGSTLFQKVARLRKVDAAIRSGKASSPAVQQAVLDFETVIGIRHGKLTEELNQFLRELERTGLITALAEQSLVKSECLHTRSAFFSLYSSICTSNIKEAEELYNAIRRSFEASLQEMFQDKALGFSVSSLLKQFEAHAKKIEASLAVIETKNHVDHTEMLERIQKIAKGILPELRSIRIETNKGLKLKEITRLFIPSKLKHRETKGGLRTTSFWTLN